jgi:flagellar FliL protein
MSDKEEAPAKPRKAKGLIVKLVGALVLVGAGGGGVFAAVQAGLIGGAHEAKKEKDFPKLVRKGEEDPYSPPAAEGAKEGQGVAEVEGEGGSEYRTVYYSFTEDFTSNLVNSDSLVQMSLAASTRRDGRVVMWIKKHELPNFSRYSPTPKRKTSQQSMASSACKSASPPRSTRS